MECASSRAATRLVNAARGASSSTTRTPAGCVLARSTEGDSDGVCDAEKLEVVAVVVAACDVACRGGRFGCRGHLPEVGACCDLVLTRESDLFDAGATR